MESGSGGACGACKFLRRKCAAECVFAPYFRSEVGPARFAAIHKVFGASNASKLLLHLPQPLRNDAVLTIAYEAQARIRDPVRGCVAHISALQQQVLHLQAELMQMRAQVAADQWLISSGGGSTALFPTVVCTNNINSHDSLIVDSINDGMQLNMMESRDDDDDDDELGMWSVRRENKRRRVSQNQDAAAHLSDLHQMALMMMDNGNS